MMSMAAEEYIVGGIQQIGIGVDVLKEAVQWYAAVFGFDVPVFREAATAPLMISYTGGEVHARDAALLLNLRGGSGVELWQFVSRRAVRPYDQLMIGDLGIYAAKIKSPMLHQAYDSFYARDISVYSDPMEDPSGALHFYLEDICGNMFEIVDHSQWFSKVRGNKKGQEKTGGVCGACIGVSDIDAALPLYRDILGYTTVVYDESAVFDDFKFLPGGKQRYRRVLLKSESRGPFADLFGASMIELIQALDRRPQRIFKGRLWGDFGFIHLCFDISNMDALQAQCAEKKLHFVVDSGRDFTMGTAAGRFAYVEDPDGTLIEFVETFRIPISKRRSLNLSARRYAKPLPSFFIHMLGTKRLKRQRGGEIQFS